MNTQEPLILQKAIEEIELKEFGATEQYLSDYNIAYENGIPKVAGIHYPSNDEANVYFNFAEDKFYLCVYVNLEPTVEVRWVDVEDYNIVYFIAQSETMTMDELCSLTTLTPTEIFYKGTPRKGYKNAVHKYNMVAFEPHLEPEPLEVKLKKLLTYLETDRNGIHKMVEQTDCGVEVCVDYETKYTQKCRPSLDATDIKRMADLGLSINYAYYRMGTPMTGE